MPQLPPDPPAMGDQPHPGASPGPGPGGAPPGTPQGPAGWDPGPPPPSPSPGGNRAGLVVLLVFLVVGVGAYFVASGDDDDDPASPPGGESGLEASLPDMEMPDPDIDVPSLDVDLPDGIEASDGSDAGDVDLGGSSGGDGGGVDFDGSTGAVDGFTPEECTSPVVPCSELAGSCAGGDLDACDQLWYSSESGSGWEAYAATCGGLVNDRDSAGRCYETYG